MDVYNLQDLECLSVLRLSDSMFSESPFDQFYNSYTLLTYYFPKLEQLNEVKLTQEIRALAENAMKMRIR
jgi:hypothetical protein